MPNLCHFGMKMGGKGCQTMSAYARAFYDGKQTFLGHPTKSCKIAELPCEGKNRGSIPLGRTDFTCDLFRGVCPEDRQMLFEGLV